LSQVQHGFTDHVLPRLFMSPFDDTTVMDKVE
jgi:hypothetical protein